MKTASLSALFARIDAAEYGLCRRLNRGASHAGLRNTFRVASRLGAFDATRGGRQNNLPVWRIAVQVRQFDAIEGVRVEAAFGWTVKRSDASLATTCGLTLSEPVGAGIDAVAQGARRVAANAAAAMASSVTAAQANPAAPCEI